MPRVNHEGVKNDEPRSPTNMAPELLPDALPMKHDIPSVFPYSPEQRKQCIDPLVSELLARRIPGGTVVVGLQGGQGTGKTTLTRFLVHQLEAAGYRTVAFSIDDFYTCAEDRRRLATRHRGNPFFQIPRGLPGTHRVRDLRDALQKLKHGVAVTLPVFDKSAHDGYGDISERVIPVQDRQDFVLFEGWFTGMPPATPDEVFDSCRHQGVPVCFPASHLETVLAYLEGYQPVWELIDCLVMLRPDSPLLHEEWRLEQERKLIEQTGAGMTEDQVRDMVRHLLLFSCWCYARTMPDLCIRINAAHQYYALESRREAKGSSLRLLAFLMFNLFGTGWGQGAVNLY